jgi:hypothetical protein
MDLTQLIDGSIVDDVVGFGINAIGGIFKI